MEKLILNIVHRPEMAPEYAEKVTGQGKSEDIGRKELLSESLSIFRLQQDIAHRNGLRTTIQMTYSSLFNPEAVELAKRYHSEFGDEISLTLLGLPCEQFRQKYHTRDFCIWMFPWEQRVAIIDDVFGLFREAFGFWPESTGSYFLDAETIAYIKRKYPSVQCAVATCWEEGPKAFHTCNNSWYTWMDGGPWAPWIPSKINSHAPARDEADDSGIVAIPHLSRDLLACYDGNGSNFGTHPQNVLRGMCYQTADRVEDVRYPYLYNLIDLYRHQAKYNNGFSYNMMFVGPGWLNAMGRWEAPFELLKKSYEDGMAYYGQLKRDGLLQDMGMAEFAAEYRRRHAYGQPEVALWRDILYGSDKQLFWYYDPDMRACINMDEGGALVDLRPYAAGLEWPVGIGTKHVQDASFPFLIQEKYRSGYFTHYVGEGTVRSAKLCHGGEEIDLCLCRTHARVERDDEAVRLVLDPVEIEFADCTAKVQTVHTFRRGSACVETARRLVEVSDAAARISLKEYMTACYGTTEYPEDMTGITLGVTRDEISETLSYDYRCRELTLPDAERVWAAIPAIHTRVSMSARPGAVGTAREGYAFSPMYTLGYEIPLQAGEEARTWLKLEREN